ncbi:GerMN domain-containing protein [Paractinoplanes atraurantiacus]|uniref:Sporulation and spore germination n=1 Tax=Paractinoplanes atraurantiacus TaxID=1036182 RepID=A0A285J4S9_9ACTN|nr:GerMN domain-containing protein [Actinoplanes atraurantiacus]SNY55284.1 Sporulation and spore germination [Actinoplanes atraurantiacus]
MRRVPILLVLLLTACGVPAEDSPHPVELPRAPLNGSGAAAVTPAGEVAHVLCLVRDERLVQSVRRAPSYPGVQQQMNELITGPTPAESSTGLSTALAGLTVTATAGPGSRVTVEVSRAEGRKDDILAYGQMVCTLTARPDVAAVSFTREGRSLEVPRADGTLTEGPLRSSDYAALVAPA